MVSAPAEDAVKTTEFPRFGTCSYRAADVFVFPWGMPGFDQLREFVVLQLETQDQIFWLQSLNDPAVAIPLGDPWTFFPDYDPKLPDYARTSIGLENAEDFTILAVMVGTPGGPTTMNLLAPVVLNLKLRVARQVALEGSRYTVAMQIPVPEAVAQAQADARALAEAGDRAEAPPT